jgi:hypothetical protein
LELGAIFFVVKFELDFKFVGENTMAKPIKETPILSGRDAKRFREIVKHNENIKVSKADFERAEKAFMNLKII